MQKIIDLHQDLMLYVAHPELQKDRQQTSFEQIKKNNIKVVVASAFVVPENEEYLSPTSSKLIEEELVHYNNYVREHSEFIIIKNQKDITRVLDTDGLFGLILHIEGLNYFDEQSDWKTLEYWYELGLRSIGPVWNLDNPFGGGTLQNNQGLTPLGKKLITWLDEKNMIIDCAHMNEKTFADTCALITKPIFVSHGNARAICADVRNYTDDQLHQIGKSDGVIGLFFSKKFITKNDTATLDDILAHIKHIKSITGIDSIALGTDFGGIFSGFADGLNSVDNLDFLKEKLLQDGYTEGDIDSIFYKNAERILRCYLT